MIPTSRPIRSLVALVTAFWTSLACCCALGAEDHRSIPNPTTDAAAHACCDSRSPQPADGHSGPEEQEQTCACGGHDRFAEQPSETQLVAKSAVPIPALDLALLSLVTTTLDPAAAAIARLQSDTPPQGYCAHSLIDQHCQLTT